MQIKQTSFCSFVLDFKNGSVDINPNKSAKSDIKIFSINNSPYLKKGGDGEGFTISSAGEFELKDIFINGRKNNGEDSFVFNISSDDVTIGVISFVNNVDTIPTEFFENTDILIIGAGGGPFMTAKDAHKLVGTLSPSVAIYCGFKEGAEKELQNTLDSVEEAKKEIPGLTMLDKSIKVDRDTISAVENTINYYFQM